jgi:hypothetical protein
LLEVTIPSNDGIDNVAALDATSNRTIQFAGAVE